MLSAARIGRARAAHLERYQQQILAALSPAEAGKWHHAVAAAKADGTFFIAQAYHCAVGTRPG